ncbi:hypothetical protein C8A01DRAFT_15989 [Parachaetomium inaequale]|uniref:Uncharacterized protein n=1 Tax=Parachaetomium inaequale TaxID=2588326 RepID=A0AAN6SRP3_9PEZI|nr:hypothetical protein C8A01DRAFT_15989 [Parachaetomium inaequale]
MDLEDISYSREATIAAVTDYYTFLTRMYLKESHVVYPPAGGWPAIVNAEPSELQSLGKSDEVLALLAHLPYIRHPIYGDGEDSAEVAPCHTVADWTRFIARLTPVKAKEIRALTEGELAYMHISPPHVVGLTMSPIDEAWVLDTELGIIHWQDCPSRIDFGDDRLASVQWDLEHEVSEEEADWRQSATAWAIPDFFELLKDQFIKLKWIPISHSTLKGVPDDEDDDEEGMIPMLQEIYRQHGWPDLAFYRKSKCLEAVQKAMAEKYPESVCWRGDD